MKRHICSLVVIVLFVVLPAKDIIRASTTSYTIEDLGTTSDGFVPVITGVNDSGQVSGYVNVGSTRAVRFTTGIGWEYLPGLGSESYAMAINASGDIAGYHVVAGMPRAFRYTHTTGVVETIALVTGGNMAWGFSINARGDVTGYGDASGAIRGWLAKPGYGTVVLPTLGGTDGVACGINDAGQIVGFSMTADGYQHAYRLEVDESLTEIVPFDGPTGTSSACAIDAAGHVGGSATSGTTHVDRAYRFLSGAPVNLDTLASKSSNVAAIANGVSVGWFVATANNAENAFVHSDAHGSANLNDLIPAGSGWLLHQALAVNTAGQIVGHGKLNNVNRAFRLTPVAAPKDTTAPVISAVSATPSTVWPPNGQLVDVAVAVTASDDVDATPVCALSSITANGTTADDYSFTGLAARVRAVGGRTYTLNVTCADAAGNVSPASSTDVVVPPDTTAPVISAVSATPSTVSPPKGQVVDVNVAVTATDDVDAAPVCAVSSISATGGTADDFSFTGLAARVRAVGGRTYTLNVTCTDTAGNVSPASSTAVVVPPDTTAPVISRVQATPDAIWPPNGKMVPVFVSVSATDDVDPTPQCQLTSVSSNGGSASDAQVTGPFTASVRSEKHGDGSVRVYTLHVQCADDAGNKSPATTTVVVGKDSEQARASLYRSRGSSR